MIRAAAPSGGWQPLAATSRGGSAVLLVLRPARGQRILRSGSGPPHWARLPPPKKRETPLTPAGTTRKRRPGAARCLLLRGVQYLNRDPRLGTPGLQVGRCPLPRPETASFLPLTRAPSPRRLLRSLLARPPLGVRSAVNRSVALDRMLKLMPVPPDTCKLQLQGAGTVAWWALMLDAPSSMLGLDALVSSYSL